MSYTDALKDSLSALQFEADGVKQLQSNVDAVTYGLLTTILAGIASAIGQLNPLGIIAYPIGMIISVAIGTGLFHLFAKLFGGQGSFRDFFAVVTNGYIAFWVSIIPLVGPILAGIAGLYFIAYQVFAIKEVYSLSVGKSIAVFLLPAIILAVLAILLAMVIGGILASIGLGMLAQV